MNYDDCIESTINDSVKDLLRRLPELEPDERAAIVIEWGEVIFQPLEIEETLMVPNFENRQNESSPMQGGS